MLSPCRACARHVRDDSAACPFCGAAHAPPRSVREPPRVGPLTRALLVYGGVTLSACAGRAEAPEPPEPVGIVDPALEAPMQPVRATPEVEVPPSARAVEAEQVREPTDRARAERAHAEGRKHPRPVRPDLSDRCCPPYGAPPVDVLI